MFLFGLLYVSCLLTIDDSGQKDTVMIEDTSSFLSLSQEVTWRSEEEAYATGGAFADIDGDGLLDLIVSEGNDMEPGFIRVYMNHGGELEETASFSSEIPQYYGHIAVGDLNGDGWTDVAVSKFLGAARFDEPGGVEVFLNQGGSLSRIPDWSWGGVYTFSLALGDVDNDQDVDIAVAAGEVYYNDPEYSFVLCNDGTGDFFLCWEADAPRYSFDVEFVDINRDGWQDLVFAHQGEGHSLHFGTETFPATTPDIQFSGDGFEGNTLDWGDINSDGFLDIVVSDNNQLGGLGVIRGWCGPDFMQCWQSQDSPRMQSALIMRDFDLDGDVDLAASSWWGALRMYEQDEGILSSEPVFIGADLDIVGEAMSWAPISAVETEWIEATSLLEIPDRRALAHVESGVWGGGYVFGDDIRVEVFVLDNMRLVLTDWEKSQGNWMFAPVPRE